MKSIIGIDIGTTNTKAVAFTDAGEVLASAGASYPVYTDAEGRHELDPEELLAAVMAVLKEVYGKVKAGVLLKEAAGRVSPASVSAAPCTALSPSTGMGGL